MITRILHAVKSFSRTSLSMDVPVWVLLGIKELRAAVAEDTVTREQERISNVSSKQCFGYTYLVF